MDRIFSKVKPDLLLHVVFRLSDFEYGRKNLINADQFIQCSALKMEKGKTFKPHKHIVSTVHWDDRIAQESWVVISGSVMCIFYDIDDTVISKPILNAGDASFTLHGGHTYMILEEGTIVYEYKTGKYLGQEFDKVFINENS